MGWIVTIFLMRDARKTKTCVPPIVRDGKGTLRARRSWATAPGACLRTPGRQHKDKAIVRRSRVAGWERCTCFRANSGQDGRDTVRVGIRSASAELPRERDG